MTYFRAEGTQISVREKSSVGTGLYSEHAHLPDFSVRVYGSVGRDGDRLKKHLANSYLICMAGLSHFLSQDVILECWGFFLFFFSYRLGFVRTHILLCNVNSLPSN